MTSPETKAANWQPVKIAYDVVLPSSGSMDESPPIILLHGVTSGKETWNEISGSLANGSGLKVYRLDARNHGDSEWSDLFDYTTMAMDVSHFMEQNNIPKAILIGHSMGGKSAMCFALKEKFQSNWTNNLWLCVNQPTVQWWRITDIVQKALLQGWWKHRTSIALCIRQAWGKRRAFVRYERAFVRLCAALMPAFVRYERAHGTYPTGKPTTGLWKSMLQMSCRNK